MRAYQAGKRVLVPERVQWVRALWDAGLATQNGMARELNVNVQVIAHIVHRLTYRDVPDRPELLDEYAGSTVFGVKIPGGKNGSSK